MKELTPLDKLKFVALHWGQEFVYGNDISEPYTNMFHVLKHLYNAPSADYKALLTPLPQITDEDAYYVGKNVNCWSWAERKQSFFENDDMKETHVAYGKIFASAIGKEYGPGLSHPFAHNSTDILHGFDYLRSKGYALPWMGLSVDEMVAAGWIKLKGGNTDE